MYTIQSVPAYHVQQVGLIGEYFLFTIHIPFHTEVAFIVSCSADFGVRIALNVISAKCPGLKRSIVSIICAVRTKFSKSLPDQDPDAEKLNLVNAHECMK